MIGLWEWAVGAYARPGVGEACLILQDRHEQNVCLLLWAAWCAETGRRPDVEAIEAACDVARTWEDTTIAPLRTVRRRLKAVIPDLEAADRQAVRTQIKTVELDAERRLLLSLQGLAPGAGGDARPVIDALAEVSRAWSPVTPRPALIVLAERLSA